MRAPLCAGFVDGAFNNNTCPPGFSKIVVEAACRSAAAAVGRLYDGFRTGADVASGCITSSNGKVYFNTDQPGAPNRYDKLLCAGKPAA